MIEVAIFTVVAFVLIVVLTKIFPVLMKVSWKFVASLLVISRLSDIWITFLYFQKLGSIGTETSPIVKRLYCWLGYSNTSLFAYFLSAALIILFSAWLIKTLIDGRLIKILIGEKLSFAIGYYFGYTFIIMSFLHAVTNYLFVLRLA